MSLVGACQSAKEEEQKLYQEDGGRGSSSESRNWKQHVIFVLKKDKSWQ